MSDTAIIWSPGLGRGDWNLQATQLQTGNDLTTAVLISLFTDRQANPDDIIPDGTNDPRGWWGDDATRPIGSRLWLLSRVKQTTKTLARAQDYIAEALKWLIDDGVVARFDITTEWTKPGFLGANVIAYEKSGAAIALNSSAVWTGVSSGVLLTPNISKSLGMSLIFFPY